LALLVNLTTLAQSQQSDLPLTEPSRLCPKDTGQGRILDVTMEIKLVDYKRADGTTMKVRTYNLVEGSGWQYCDGRQRPIQNPQIPGPTFQLRKGTAGKTDGDQFRMTLVNKLPADSSNHACNPIRDFSAPVTLQQQGQQCNAEAFPLVQTTMPACFHGDNVTNFHYHGFHVSPQFHQDFVLLNLYPEGSQHVTPDDFNALGSYRYALDPLPYTQAEGTHWYHPHKHGSTTLQVLNGMAGTFVLTGPFDDWLNKQFNDSLEDKVLVIQQIAQEINFFNATPPAQFTNCTSWPCTCKLESSGSPSNAAPTLVNGQIDPVITMRPGEIQRWRLINSMVQIGGLLKIGFSSEFQIKQIAQDGVQFSPENYQSQPLLGVAWFVPGQAPQMLSNANLAPGNRVDYLVKAPMVTTRTCYQNVYTVVGNVAQVARRLLAAKAQTPTELLTVCVDPSLGPKPMAFPTQWPLLPPFLDNIPPQPTARTVAFSMTGPDKIPTNPGDPRNDFYIDDVQYCPNCANQTMTLGEPVEWLLTNNSSPQHPFHIHINPHQLVEQGFMMQSTPPNGPYDTPVAVQKYPSPVWEDTIALANQGNCWNIPAGPIWNSAYAQQKCPGVCSNTNTNLLWKGNWVTTVQGEMSVCNCCAPDNSPGYTRIRQQPMEFTGEFVLHCHILGHEDRGMMQNVQVICPSGPTPGQDFFGKPRPGQAECVDGNYIPAAPRCPKEGYKTDPKCPVGS
jgi:FtsP/CotA-like multicopper oxidase with cupredoxin domain